MDNRATRNRSILNYSLEAVLAILLFSMAFGAPYTPWGFAFPWDLVCTIVFTSLALIGLFLFLCIWLTAKRKKEKLHLEDYLFASAIVLAVIMGIVCLILY
ncbi:MAG: hypothetical protein LBG88_04265 [Christensenellaceae bacterium]|jgi:heme/copper-type cytochrome/quinol oxidase subunit 4|nr:hypothetical protein [Christensenellaceae bacterium]